MSKKDFENNKKTKKQKKFNNKQFFTIIGVLVAILVVVSIVLAILGIQQFYLFTGPLIIILVLAPIITIMVKSIDEERQFNLRAAEYQARTEKNNRENIEKGKKYFQENDLEIQSIVKKYQRSIFNYAEKLSEIFQKHKIDNILLKLPTNGKAINLSAIFLPVSTKINPLLEKILEYDGIVWNDNHLNHYSIECYNEIAELTKYVAQVIKQKIISECHWIHFENFESIASLVYLIFRNNLIKFYHDRFANLSDVRDLTQFCSKYTADDTYLITLFTYYLMYENDINLPIKDNFKNFNDVITTKLSEANINKN